MARLSHPSIVAVFDTVADGDVEAVVMELVPGDTLRQRLDAVGRLPIGLTIQIGIAIADALTAAHRSRIVHRDIKPGNVLLDPEGRILLTDFGIAKALQHNDDVTSDDVLMGTAKYLSPEQVLGLPVDSRADLYSLGVLLYECLAGQPPFVADTQAATAMARLAARSGADPQAAPRRTPPARRPRHGAAGPRRRRSSPQRGARPRRVGAPARSGQRRGRHDRGDARRHARVRPAPPARRSRD